MITQSTNFPDEDQTLLTIKSSSTQQIDLKIRIPFWIKNKSMVVRVNNKIVKGIKSEKVMLQYHVNGQMGMKLK